jgi:hypothetical protein
MLEWKDEERLRTNANISYGEAAQKINSTGGWTDWYRDAINEKGESLGNHEVKVLKLYVKDKLPNTTL